MRVPAAHGFWRVAALALGACVAALLCVPNAYAWQPVMGSGPGFMMLRESNDTQTENEYWKVYTRSSNISAFDLASGGWNDPTTPGGGWTEDANYRITVDSFSSCWGYAGNSAMVYYLIKNTSTGRVWVIPTNKVLSQAVTLSGIGTSSINGIYVRGSSSPVLVSANTTLPVSMPATVAVSNLSTVSASSSASASVLGTVAVSSLPSVSLSASTLESMPATVAISAVGGVGGRDLSFLVSSVVAALGVLLGRFGRGWRPWTS